MLARMTALLMTAAATVAVMAAAQAQTTEATPIPAPPKPDFAPMSFMVGTWSCSSQSARRPSPSAATITWSMDPTGYWLVGETKTTPVPWYPHAGTFNDMVTYDAQAKQWVDISTGSDGAWDLSTSPGPSGNTLVWHEQAFGKFADVASNADSTWTKVSPTKLTSVSSFTTTKGRTVGVSGSCNKTG